MITTHQYFLPKSPGGSQVVSVSGRLLSLAVLCGVFLFGHACSQPDEGKSENQTVATVSEDATALCKEKAAEDPYVDDAELAEKIYLACIDAARSLPDDHEIAYLMATSALETNRTEEAFYGFLRAEQLGNCNALYFLGDFALHDQKDFDAAETFYTRGAECGDERAEWELFSSGVFEKSANPKLLKALYESDVEALNKTRFITASYVYGFYEGLDEQYLGPDFEVCWKATHFGGGETLNDLEGAENGDASNLIEGKAYEYALPQMFQVLYPAQGQDALVRRRESQRKAGKADLTRLVNSYKCDSLIAFKLVKGVEEFAKKKKSLLEWGRETAPNMNVEDILKLPNMLRNGEFQIDEP